MKKFLIPLIIILFLFTLTYAQDSKVKLIGITIAENVGEDDYGLTLIDGIFSIISFEKLPNTDSFPLYSRWMGYGTHEIEFNILNPDKDKTLANIKDILDLELPNEVTYILSYFEDIAFENTGVYWIQAKVDGEVVKEIPIFVLEEGEGDIENADTNPILIFSLPCLEVYENDHGLPSIGGIFEYYMTEELPFVDNFLIANGWLSGEGLFTQRLEIISPSGKLLYSSNKKEFEINPGSLIIIVDYIEDFSYEEEGDYLIKVYLNEEEVGSYVLKVVVEE